MQPAILIDLPKLIVDRSWCLDPPSSTRPAWSQIVTWRPFSALLVFAPSFALLFLLSYCCYPFSVFAVLNLSQMNPLKVCLGSIVPTPARPLLSPRFHLIIWLIPWLIARFWGRWMSPPYRTRQQRFELLPGWIVFTYFDFIGFLDARPGFLAMLQSADPLDCC